MRRLVVACLLLPACFDDASELGTEESELRVCAAGPTVKGIDVSYYQGDIDWPKVRAAGVDFAFIRVSDGLRYQDSKFAVNWDTARSVGIVRGVYQFFRPSLDPIAQANLLLERMGALAPDDLPPVIDVEVADDQDPAVIVDRVRQWIDHVAAATGRKPIIYTGKYSWANLTGSADFTRNPLWMAHWEVKCPDLPAPWKGWSFWQTSAKGRLDGIGNGQVDVDLDVFNGDLAALQDFATGTAECGDGRCTASESAVVCPVDCRPCGIVPAEGGVVDDASACFVGGGDPMYLRVVDGAGWDSRLVWTYTTASATESTFAEWRLHLAGAGRYRVEAHIDGTLGRSQQARYQVRHAGAVDEVVVKQAGTPGWRLIGDFDFATGGDQWVHLGDNTGEPRPSEVQLVFDAIRLSRVPSEPAPLPNPGDPDPGDPGMDDEGNASGSVSGGCSTGGGPTGSGLTVVLALAALGRRRARR